MLGWRSKWQGQDERHPVANRHTARLLLLSAELLATSAARANEPNKWNLDVSLYGLAVGMAGDIGIGRVNADIAAGFDKI